MDPYLNCLYSICCPPEARAAAMTKLLTEHGLDTPEKFAAFLFKHFDLVPAGSLRPLVTEVARLARGADYKP